ncbi:MAG: endo-1,4-beta-xylanase [Ignavibacteriaceae bacterium]
MISKEYGSLIFKPVFVQNGKGPNINEFVYASDINGDAFQSNIQLNKNGIYISDVKNKDKFAIHVRWNVEGYGNLYLYADNGGEFYKLPKSGTSILNLNYELAKSRAMNNQKRIKKFCGESWTPSKELNSLNEIANEYLSDSFRSGDEGKKSRLAQTSLKYSLFVSDLLELEKSRFDILNNGRRNDFFIGCDSRGYFQMENKKLFMQRFTELFDYATITHYLIGDHINFEPEEGIKQFKERKMLVKKFRNRKITVEGRPLFWAHAWVTPDWLKNKNYSKLLTYVEKHVKEVVGYYKDEIQVWEVVNEIHDWANEVELNNEQTIELTKLACDVARYTNPNIRLLVNNCCPFADYVQGGKWGNKKAKFPQRTPHQFISQIIEAGVDFDIIGLQVYFTFRPPSDTVLNIESFKEFGKKIHLAEVGAPSSGITKEFVNKDISDYSLHPFEWKRHWDEELQADWLEYIFSYAYSQPLIEAANWYDFVDPHSYLKFGGLLRSPKGEKKAAFDRLLKLKSGWNDIPFNQKCIK